VILMSSGVEGINIGRTQVEAEHGDCRNHL
jgi:hypothetical protein